MAPKATWDPALAYMPNIACPLVIQGSTLHPFSWKYPGCESGYRREIMKVLTISGHQIEESIDSQGFQESESTEHEDNNGIHYFIFTTDYQGQSDDTSFWPE